MDTPILSSLTKLPSMAVTDVYTDLSGLQQLQSEENQDAALKKIAQQFESLFINMMLKNMRSANAVFEQDSMFNSNEMKFYRDMYDHQLSLTLAHGNGIGIADAMYRQLSRSYGENDQPAPLPLTGIIDRPKKSVEPEVKSSEQQLDIAIAQPMHLDLRQSEPEGPQPLATQMQPVLSNMPDLPEELLDNSEAIVPMQFTNGTQGTIIGSYDDGTIDNSVSDYIDYLQQESRELEAEDVANGLLYLKELKALQKPASAIDSANSEKALSAYQSVSKES